MQSDESNGAVERSSVPNGGEAATVAAPAPQPVARPPVPQRLRNDEYDIRRLLAAMPMLTASDLHLKIGIPPTYRVGGMLKPVNGEPLSEEAADRMFEPIWTAEKKEQFERLGAVDFAWYLDDGPHEGERFRINVFRSGGHTHGAIRRVQGKIPSYDELHLPPVYSKIIREATQGLVLVVGVTGSGKSSTLAAMINQVNHTRGVNIITIEDPVEFRFTPEKSIISQREVGIDVHDFPSALRSVVRQDPDVIFIGEMRDKDTILAGIQAAETGHLVFATLHTADTMQAFGRILEFFPQEERGFVRAALSSSLKAICAQKLLPAVSNFETKIVPATEVLLSNATVRDKIREGEEADLPAIINTSEGEGMHSFTKSLGDLVNKDWVDLHTALDYAPNRDALNSMIRGVQVKAQTLVGKIKK
ncbi:MAG: twitching motility protein PilT [Phycisphaerae bacterium]|nr:twitching motility protein PilT [Phycisphaerae bacterium]